MLPSLKDQFVSTTYIGLLHTSNQPLSAGLQTVYDGLGNASPLKLSTSGVQVGNLTIPLSAGNAGEVIGVVGNNIGFVSVFPVGSVYFTSVNTSPSSFLGGTWVNIAQGRFIAGIGVGTGDNGVTKTIQSGNNNGEYSHVMSVSELPAHTHTGYTAVNGVNGAATGASVGATWSEFFIGKKVVEHENSGHSNTLVTSSSTPAMGLDGVVVLDNTGSGSSFNISPPSFGLYVWQRTE
jgi:hypothetical protein